MTFEPATGVNLLQNILSRCEYRLQSKKLEKLVKFLGQGSQQVACITASWSVSQKLHKPAAVQGVRLSNKGLWRILRELLLALPAPWHRYDRPGLDTTQGGVK